MHWKVILSNWYHIKITGIIDVKAFYEINFKDYFLNHIWTPKGIDFYGIYISAKYS